MRAVSAVRVGTYGKTIDQACDTATQKLRDAITTQSGQISQSNNLDGLIGEHHHANSFNLDAAIKGKDVHAHVQGFKCRKLSGYRTAIAGQVGKQALQGAAIAVGIQGLAMLGRRGWNSLTGKTNQPAGDDWREFGNDSVRVAAHAGGQSVVSGGFVGGKPGEMICEYSVLIYEYGMGGGGADPALA